MKGKSEIWPLLLFIFDVFLSTPLSLASRIQRQKCCFQTRTVLKALKCFSLKLVRFRQIIDFPINNCVRLLIFKYFFQSCKPLWICMNFFFIPLYTYVILKLSTCFTFNPKSVVYLRVENNFTKYKGKSYLLWPAYWNIMLAYFFYPTRNFSCNK